jgi:hypothetical protein
MSQVYFVAVDPVNVDHPVTAHVSDLTASIRTF